MAAPAASAKATERRRLSVSDGNTERFEGYWLMALPLSSGHLFAFRRCTTSSIGPPFSSLWHRDPEGRWTIHVDVTPGRACPRHFASALHDVRVGGIDAVWKTPYELSIYAQSARIHVMLRLAAAPATRLLSAAAQAVPSLFWRSAGALRVLGRSAGRVLDAGTLGLHGTTPSGRELRLRPRALWQVEASAVVHDGRDLGDLGVCATPITLAGMSLPQRPLFAVGGWEYVT